MMVTTALVVAIPSGRTADGLLVVPCCCYLGCWLMHVDAAGLQVLLIHLVFNNCVNYSAVLTSMKDSICSLLVLHPTEQFHERISANRYVFSVADEY